MNSNFVQSPCLPARRTAKASAQRMRWVLYDLSAAQQLPAGQSSLPSIDGAHDERGALSLVSCLDCTHIYMPTPAFVTYMAVGLLAKALQHHDLPSSGLHFRMPIVVVRLTVLAQMVYYVFPVAQLSKQHTL